jgi:hypothetical protein
MNSSQSKVYVKDRYEHWDDFQIKSAIIGGNKKMFSHLKEFEIDKWDPSTRYSLKAVDWYKRKHAHLLNGLDEDTFLDKKPSQAPKIKETLKNT